ncbi:hypothetical protein HPB51_012540 [Rhipicephalus microplus]|uniref:Uncharacterized protein n=1 Tax=Rhipicephalus microplus TaxID=6941 RepID=A0A9J6DGL5_RHIMP|nr:hypothetical protein HPB51_012540 [Rhipicephalus microplus]
MLCRIALFPVLTKGCWINHVVWLSPLVVCVFLAGIPIWVYLSKRNPYTREVLCTGWVPVICAMGISR